MSQRRVVRAALTDAYQEMPENVADLGQLKDFLPDIRRANVQHHIDLMAQARQQGVAAICFGE